MFDAWAYLRDEKSNGTNGGDLNSGAWRTRDLNTEVFDTDGFVSLSSNQFTLAAGTYRIKARAPTLQVQRNKLRIRNVTDGSTSILGASSFGATGVNIQAEAFLDGRVTIAGSKAFELQQIVETSVATFGGGVASSLDSTIEIFSEVWIYREA